MLATSILLSAVTLSCGGAGDGIGPTTLTLEQQLQEALDEGFTQVSNGKGFSVAVWTPSQPMWTGVAGVSHGAIPITRRSVFAAGSITKTFTALTVLRLAEAGILDLDDSLHSWLPDYTHVDRDINMEEYLLTSIAAPYFAKGTAWSYSTTGYVLLRMIIEQVTGGTIAEAYRSYVIEPLGLLDTYTCHEESLPGETAHGWLDITGDGVYDDFSTIPNTSFCSAAGGQIFTTASDLAMLARALMHRRTFLRAATYNEMTDFYLPSGHDEPMVQGYGLGLMWFNNAWTSGQTIWGHGGNAPGYAAGMLYMVDYGTVVTLMDNTEEGEAMVVLDRILDVITQNVTRRE
jgi:D-alanyl-D-alanine carboxypeptidase